MSTYVVCRNRYTIIFAVVATFCNASFNTTRILKKKKAHHLIELLRACAT